MILITSVYTMERRGAERTYLVHHVHSGGSHVYRLGSAAGAGAAAAFNPFLLYLREVDLVRSALLSKPLSQQHGVWKSIEHSGPRLGWTTLFCPIQSRFSKG